MPGSWSLRYPGVDVTFAEGSGVTLREFPGESSPTITDEDYLNVRVDGSSMGVDTIGGRTIPLSFAIDGPTEAIVRGRWAQLRSWWRADAVRSTPGAVAELVSDQGRSAFGRPRRIEPTLAWYHDPVMTVEADFAAVDDLWYGAEDSLQVPFALSQSGGFVFREYADGDGPTLVEDPAGSGLFSTAGLVESPAGSGLYAPDVLVESPSASGLYATTSSGVVREGLRFPLVTRGYTTSANTFEVAGEEATWPVITIQGPVLNPTVEVAGKFRFSAATSLKYDESLTIDTRPGRQTVLRNGSRIASLTRTSSLLSDAALPPGSYTFTLSGSSSTGAPTAQITWRSAYSTP